MVNYNKFPHSGGPLFSCLSCDRAFSGIEDLQALVKRKHTDWSIKNKYQCLICEYSCDRPSHLNLHQVAHTSVKTASVQFVIKVLYGKRALHHISNLFTPKSRNISVKVVIKYLISAVIYFAT